MLGNEETEQWRIRLTFDLDDCIIRASEGQRMNERLADALDPVDIATIHVFRLAANSEVELHYHDFDEYWLFMSGTPTVTLRSAEGETRTYHLGPGDIVACAKGIEHTLWADHDLVYFQMRSRIASTARGGHLTRNP